MAKKSINYVEVFVMCCQVSYLNVCFSSDESKVCLYNFSVNAPKY